MTLPVSTRANKAKPAAVDLALTESALRKVADSRAQSGAIDVAAVIQTVSEFFGVSLVDLG